MTRRPAQAGRLFDVPDLNQLTETRQRATPSHMTQHKTRALASLALPFGVLMLGGALTISAWRIAQHTEQQRHHTRFEQRVNDLQARIEGRMGAYAQMLKASAALFAAEQHVSRRAWRAYVESLDLATHYPGALGLGYVARIRHDELSNHIVGVRAEGFANYTVWPEGRRDEHAAILYLEPFTGVNVHALGYDMLSEPTRQAALRDARDTGQATLSGRVTLVQSGKNTKEPGILFYVPVYRADLMAYTVEERRAALQGYVYSPFRMSQLMPSILGDGVEGVSLVLFEGSTQTDESVLFSTSAVHNMPAPGALVAERSMGIAGRTWTMRVSSLPAFDAVPGTRQSTYVLISGSVLSLMAFALTLLLATTRRRAILMARDMSRAHKHSEDRIRAVMDGTTEAILSIGSDGFVRSCNRSAQDIFGYTEEEFLTLHARELASEDHRADVDRFINARRNASIPANYQRQFEISGRHRAGHTITLRCALSAIEIDHERQYVCLCSDITQQRSNEEQARRADALRQAVLDSAPLCIITTDTQGCITGINPAGEALLGYRRDELVGRHTPGLIHVPEEVAQRRQALSAELGRPLQSTFEVFISGAEHGHIDQHEWHYVRKDGSLVPVVLTTAALRDPEGQLTGYVGIANDISERKRTDEYIRHLALHDKLTGLPNRVLLQDHAALAIARARQQRTGVAVLLLDLDRFKHINDSLGHHVGDVVLQIVANRLRECVRSSDTVVRMGGDEFVILLSDIKSPDEAQRVADKVMSALSHDLVAGDHTLRITPSIGIALFPDNGNDLSTLLKNADAAMYHAKDAGRNNVQVFAPRMNEQLSKRLEIEADLNHALERNELVLFYQPQIDGRTGMVCGVEALLRWQHPKRGMVSPLDFIPIAEETGLILPIGDWVMRTACADIKRLGDECRLPLRAAVNLSPRQFTQPDLVEHVEQALAQSGLPHHLFELEITEGVLMHDIDQTLETLNRLRQLGLHLAIDDFGTGFSSLSYLSRFPIQTLKVDRSFVKDIGANPTNAAIASAVIGMAHTLGMRVVAEGVETDEQRDFLRERRCDELQGYLYAKPLPLHELKPRIEAIQAVCATPAH